MDQARLETPITYLKGVGPNRANLLQAELGIHTFADLLHHFPFRYIDKTRIYKISELQRHSGEVQLKGRLVHLKTVEQKRGKRLVATFVDETGEMELVWFRAQKWLKDNLKLNVPYLIYGRVNWYNGKFSMPHPEMDTAEENAEQKTQIQPVYPSTEKLSNKGVTNKVMRQWIFQLLSELPKQLPETLPANLLEEYRLPTKWTSLKQVHFPDSQDHLSRARFRLKFEELFYVQLALLSKKQQRKLKFKGFVFDEVGAYFNNFYTKHLPFQLTAAQKKVIREIRADLGSNAQMNRLLQGDVGSGKTIVAVLTILLALDNGYQACLVAPTEILAQQHFQSVSEHLERLGIQSALLTGSVKGKDRKIIYQSLSDGSLPVLIGTHAVLEDAVVFQNLGLAIVDEQHRFGVAQRSKLWKKNTSPPHILVMTATPIPRTLAMSLYGDLDISVIDELPPGRKPIKTVHRFDSNRLKVFGFLKQEIKKGRQVYIVYPLIKESEALDYKDLMDGYESISREFPLPQYQISIVHGQMKPADKEFEMRRFTSGESQIMVATTVIEVGVNVPNASVMIIESAERFGLSQLHQLRGRVGRGADQSYCILMTGNKLSEEAKTRVETMVRTNDGFEIAEADLRLRGPGDLMGTQQSGILNLRMADVVKDQDILKLARSKAQLILGADPQLQAENHQMILRKLQKMRGFSQIWNFIS